MAQDIFILVSPSPKMDMAQRCSKVVELWNKEFPFPDIRARAWRYIQVLSREKVQGMKKTLPF